MKSSPLKPRLAWVVKYYYPMPRISGILYFTYDLIGALANDFDIRVFTSRHSPEVPLQEDHRGYRIDRREGVFPLRAGRAVRIFNPDVLIFGSGFWRPYYLLPYWELFRLGLGRFSGPVFLLQYSNMTRIFSGLCRLLFPRPGQIITTTESLKNFWENFFPGRIHYIPPGVDLKSEVKDTTFPLPKRRRIRIGFFGHLQAHKGPDIVLKIFQGIKPEQAELLINGEGELMNSLRQAARGWDNIIIQEYVPDITPWLRSCDLVILPYRSAVSVLGYSRVALETLAAGVPLITTQNPATAPLIRNGENGFVCRSEGELTERLQTLIDNDGLRKDLAAGAARSAERFDIIRISNQYRQLINQALPGREKRNSNL